MPKKKKMVFKKSWNEFREIGLLWFVNRTLHLFGWAIVVEIDPKTKKTINGFPAKCKFRGFSEKCEIEGFKKVTKYLGMNHKRLTKEANE